MSTRKLKALGYYDSQNFKIDDETHRRKLVSWLEDQMIRHYTVEERAPLRDVASSNWQEAYKKYLDDVSCPYDANDFPSSLDWLLSFALRLEYEDNAETYQLKANELAGQRNGEGNAPKLIRSNPLDNLDFESNEFKQGVEELADYLKVPLHPNHLITLAAISKVIQRKYSGEGILQEKQTKEQSKLSGVTVHLNDTNLGFTTGDKILDKAAKVLRLLHINDVRQLQTVINRVIVEVQEITANPKTDTSLGQTGRK